MKRSMIASLTGIAVVLALAAAAIREGSELWGQLVFSLMRALFPFLLLANGFAQMRAMSTRNDEPQKASRPWDKGRDGFVLGEGAGVLVLERAADAAARNRAPYATVAGAARSSS